MINTDNMENKLSYTEIVKKLIGNVQPAGDSSIDPQRLENLKQLCDLTENLVAEIKTASTLVSRYEHSIALAGRHAENSIKIIAEICL